MGREKKALVRPRMHLPQEIFAQVILMQHVAACRAALATGLSRKQTNSSLRTASLTFAPACSTRPGSSSSWTAMTRLSCSAPTTSVPNSSWTSGRCAALAPATASVHLLRVPHPLCQYFSAPTVQCAASARRRWVHALHAFAACCAQTCMLLLMRALTRLAAASCAVHCTPGTLPHLSTAVSNTAEGLQNDYSRDFLNPQTAYANACAGDSAAWCHHSHGQEHADEALHPPLLREQQRR